MITEPRQLAVILKKEYEAARDYSDHLLKLQRLAQHAYEADAGLIPFTEGRSRVMLPDVQEAHDYMLASVLRVFVSGDRTIEFEAVDEGDEEAADEATAAIDYNFMRQQDGYRLLTDMCHDGLLRKIGVVKTVAEDVEKVTRETVQAHPLQLWALPEEVEIEDLREMPGGYLEADLKITRVERCFRDYIIPPSRFKFSPRARHEDDADYIGDEDLKTRSELIEMGFDPEQVAALPKYSHFEDIEEDEQAQSRQGWIFKNEASSPALEKVLLHEEYTRIDVDGDGIAERIKTYRVENEILRDAETGEIALETVEEQPYSVFTPFPRPHALVGYSLADKVMDLMIQRSFIARQLFDGMALSNMPRYEVPDSAVGENTLNDILSPIPGSPIRTRGPGLREVSQTFDASKSLQVMEWLTGERETRTGITRLNQGLDANTLNKTATGAALMQAQGQQQEEYIARNFAEALSRLFVKKYRLMRRESDPFTIRVDGQARVVNPSSWPESVHVRVRVGLGTNNKDKRLGALTALQEPLMASIEMGFSGHEHAFNMFDRFARDAGVGQGEDFMFDPTDPEFIQRQQMAAQQPDPEQEAAMADMQRDMMEKQADRQLKLVELDGKMVMEERKQEREERLAYEKLAVERETNVDVSNQRQGGSVAS